METTLLFEPTDPTIKTLDLQLTNYILEVQQEITASIEQVGYSHHDGQESTFALLESHPVKGKKLIPYRTITTEGMFGMIDATQQIESLGFTCINKNQINRIQGFDYVFVLK